MAAPPLRLIPGSRGVPDRIVISASEVDELRAEIVALRSEARALAELALPAARQLAIIARAFGPHAGGIGDELVRLLERQLRRHGEPPRAA